jgi:predicted TIM-barrel fold metal-dependent hydrolase
MPERNETLGRREWLSLSGLLLAACTDASLDADPANRPLDAGNAALDAGRPARDAATRSDAAAATRDGSADARPQPLDRGWGDDLERERDLIDFHAYFDEPPWSLDAHLLLMDRAGIDISVLAYGGDRSDASINDEASALVARSPERLRFYATLPLGDVDAAIAEWRRVGTQSGCVGVVMPTNASGVYPGDSSLDRLWQSLHEARALVLLRPVPPPGYESLGSDEPFSSAELLFEPVRACMSLFEGGVLTRFPNLRVIVPYCSGALAIVLDRMRTFGIAGYSTDPLTINAELAQLWFDCAGTPFPTQLPALIQQVAPGRVLYGSAAGKADVESIHAQIVSLEQTVSPADPSWRDTLVKSGAPVLTR